MSEKLMQLSRRIPARIKTVKFRWCQKNFTKMSQQFRNIRARMKNSLGTCFWCNHKFLDGETMAIAGPEKGMNKVLCQSCAEELQASISTEQEPKDGQGRNNH